MQPYGVQKIILTQIPAEIVDVISIPPIDLMKHGIKLSLLDPDPPLNLYTSNQLFLIIIGYQPCITYVQIEKSSKGFGVREIKQGANKLVKSAFNLVTKSISLVECFHHFGDQLSISTLENSDTDDENDGITQQLVILQVFDLQRKNQSDHYLVHGIKFNVHFVIKIEGSNK